MRRQKRVKIIKNILYLLFVFCCSFSGVNADALPLLTNYDKAGFGGLDQKISHYEYVEKLERGKVKQSLDYEFNESQDIQEEMVENEIEVDDNPRTNFVSTEHEHKDKDDSKHVQVDLFGDGDTGFSYFHQLPPAVDPDVSGSPKLNDYDFRTDLIEFEYILRGWSHTNTSSFEVRIQDDSEDIALLGYLSFDGKQHNGHYEFRFEFEQYALSIGGAGIDQELYDALADGIFDINIVRSAGDGDLYIKRSKLELEQPESLSAPEPTTVPEPATILLAGSGLAGLALSYRRKW